MWKSALAVLVLFAACSPSTTNVGGAGGSGASSGSGGGSSSAGGGDGGGSSSTGGGIGGAGGGSFSADSFYAQCNGAPTTLTGTALAPNGTDPVFSAQVSVYAAVPPALPRGVLCETCQNPLEPAALATTTA